MSTTKRKRAPGAGRPLLSSEKMVAVSVRMTLEQKAKLQQLGGAQFIREVIDKSATSSSCTR